MLTDKETVQEKTIEKYEELARNAIDMAQLILKEIGSLSGKERLAVLDTFVTATMTTNIGIVGFMQKVKEERE